MAQLHFLNRKRIKEIFEVLKTQYGLKKGYEDKLDYVFMINNDNKISIISHSLSNINLDALHISSLGLYFGELKENENNKDNKNDEIRLSIEGSQIIGPLATKNVVEISEGLMRLWIRGYDIEVNINDKSNIEIMVNDKSKSDNSDKQGKPINDKPNKSITKKHETEKQENAFVIVKCQEPHAKAGGVSTTQPIEKRVVLEHAQKPRFLTYKNDFFGCGRLKDGIILNHIPKERRIKCED